MKRGVQLVLVAGLAAVAGLVGGYFLGRSAGPDGAGVAGKDGLAVGRSPLLMAGEGPGSGSDAGPEAEGAVALAGGDDLAFLGTEGKVKDTIGEILEQPGPMGRWKEMMRLALEGDDAAVAAALEDLQELPQSIDTIVSKFFLYSRYADGDPAAALDAMKELSPDERNLASRSVMGGWAAEDPLAAAKYVEQFIEEDGVLEGVSGDAVEALVHEWARQDPEAAMEWGHGLTGEMRDKAIGIALDRWSWNDPEAAAAAAMALPADEKRGEYIGSIAKNWAQRDPGAVIAWSEGLPEGERGQAQAMAVRQWASDAPVAAAEYSWNMAPGPSRDRAMRDAASEWADHDPLAAADWVVARAEGKNAQNALGGVVYRWTKEDSMGASQWISEQPPGPVTDQAIATLSGQVVNRDPEGAAIWASTITDANWRERQIKNVATKWLKKDREAARGWILSSPMSEEVRAELLAK